jgi:hypothetical protein
MGSQNVSFRALATVKLAQTLGFHVVRFNWLQTDTSFSSLMNHKYGGKRF